MSIFPPVMVVKKTNAGLVISSSNKSAVIIPGSTRYSPIVALDIDPPHVLQTNIGTQGNKGSTGLQGERGEKGEKGISGEGDLHYKYTQGSASEKWEIIHNLKKYPSVAILDSANEYVEGSIEYINENSVVLNFSAAFSGTAFLN